MIIKVPHLLLRFVRSLLSRRTGGFSSQVVYTHKRRVAFVLSCRLFDTTMVNYAFQLTNCYDILRNNWTDVRNY